MEIGRILNGKVIYGCGKCPWKGQGEYGQTICQALFNSEAQEAGESPESVGAVIRDPNTILTSCKLPHELGCNFDKPLEVNQSSIYDIKMEGDKNPSNQYPTDLPTDPTMDDLLKPGDLSEEKLESTFKDLLTGLDEQNQGLRDMSNKLEEMSKPVKQGDVIGTGDGVYNANGTVLQKF